MKALTLIDVYRHQHAGKSAIIDAQLVRAERALKDATRNREQGDQDFTTANLYLARGIIYSLLEAIFNPDAIRRMLVHIFSAIDDELCAEQKAQRSATK